MPRHFRAVRQAPDVGRAHWTRWLACGGCGRPSAAWAAMDVCAVCRVEERERLADRARPANGQRKKEDRRKQAGEAEEAGGFGGRGPKAGRVRTQSAAINSSGLPGFAALNLIPFVAGQAVRRLFDSFLLLTMMNLASSSRAASRSIQRLAAGFATAAEPIGATKVPMSRLEPNVYINYQRIEDNLAVVRDRSVSSLLCPPRTSSPAAKAQASLDPVRKDCLRPSRRPSQPGYRARHELSQASP